MATTNTIINIGEFRLRKRDKWNWELEEFRAPDSSKARSNAPIKDKTPKWRSMEHYFGSIGAGVSWLLEHEMLNGGGEYDLEGAILRFGEIAAELRSHVNRATEGNLMGFYERFKPRGGIPFNPKEAVKRYNGFRYGEGMRIEIGDTVIVADDREAGMFKVRMLNPSGMRVTVSKQSDVRQVEPSDLMFVHRR